jgi:hypothetical protein
MSDVLQAVLLVSGIVEDFTSINDVTEDQLDAVADLVAMARNMEYIQAGIEAVDSILDDDELE